MKELIILAGGLGTRLRPTVKDLPKSMAPVSGRPFIDYIIQHFLSEGIERFIFALGFEATPIKDYLQQHYPQLDMVFSVESEPLGTGGAIKLACQYANEAHVAVTNGDTLFKINLAALSQLHQAKKADCTLSLKPMENFDRFGVVELTGDQQIKAFKEKMHFNKGLINGGCYILNVAGFLAQMSPDKFSFEKDYLEKLAGKGRLYGQEQDVYFIDMGVPEDYQRAQKELS